MVADFTSAVSIRALLGVSIKELPDDTILDSFFWLSLQAEMYRIGPTLEADYRDAIELVDTDAAASNFAGAVSLFATYAVANSCITALPQFAARSVTDGKAGFIRHTSTALDMSFAKLETEYARARSALVALYLEYLPDSLINSTSVRGFMQISTPASDPVRGT